MKKSNALTFSEKDVVKMIFQRKYPDTWLQKLSTPEREKGLAFSPTNIALVKYWGKRDVALNLPLTSSLSITLPDKGCMTHLSLHSTSQHNIILNDKLIGNDTAFAKRLLTFINLFSQNKNNYFKIEITSTVPIAAGLASSACGFASIMAALNDLFAWDLSARELSILARLGSGSATRSFWRGFVEWHAGVQSDGMDSFAEPLAYNWPNLRIGILPIAITEKTVSSREAMQRTVGSSVLYESWPKKVMADLALIKQAIKMKNMMLFGGTAESNALNMHATMLSSWPPICYFMPGTINAMHTIWRLRQQGLELFFTQDAGPNLKLLFQSKDQSTIHTYFPSVEVISPFE